MHRTRTGLATAILLLGMVALSLRPGVVAAAEQERAFVDVYLGITRLRESDVPQWTFADTKGLAGARFGFWLGENWGLTFRTWYFQSDATQPNVSPSDLAFLGLSLELIARWPLGEHWFVYGSLGPAVAVTTLDAQLDPATRKEADARSLAVGVSGGLGVEFRFLKYLGAFAELQSSLVYPSFDLPDRTISPRLLNLYGLAGIRVVF
jgi:hypothetical protein